MAKLGWAVRRLSDGPGPASGLAHFPGRHETAISRLLKKGFWGVAAGKVFCI